MYAFEYIFFEGSNLWLSLRCKKLGSKNVFNRWKSLSWSQNARRRLTLWDRCRFSSTMGGKAFMKIPQKLNKIFRILHLLENNWLLYSKLLMWIHEVEAIIGSFIIITRLFGLIFMQLLNRQMNNAVRKDFLMIFNKYSLDQVKS